MDICFKRDKSMLVTAFLTLSFQTIKAAIANPVKKSSIPSEQSRNRLGEYKRTASNLKHTTNDKELHQNSMAQLDQE